MKKKHRIILLLLALIFLTTYNPHYFDLISITKSNFFEIQNIIIKNNSIIKESEIREKLGEIYKKNIFLIKRDDIEKPLKKIDFFEKVEVIKKYPNVIHVKIFETKPVAILFKNKIKYLLDSSSRLVVFNENMTFTQLPTVFGKEAENNFIYFFNLLEDNNFSTKKVKNFHYFQIGRWDVHLENDKIIKFPYNDIEYAIQKSVELLDRKEFENYNIIDLRVDGKIIVE